MVDHETAEIQVMNSSKITSERPAHDIIEDNLKKLKTEIKESIEEKYKHAVKRFKREMHEKEKRLVDISALTGISNWLRVL